jgi:hypothetical protein
MSDNYNGPAMAQQILKLQAECGALKADLALHSPIQSYTIKFHNNTGVVGKLDFNGPKMVFTGNADESVDAFIRAFGHWFDKRLKQERENEREACEKMLNDNWYKTQSDAAAAIRARGEV